MELKECPNCSHGHFDPQNCKHAQPGATYVPVEWPKRYCSHHATEMTETDVVLVYDERSGRTKEVICYLRCPKRDFLIFRCTESWVMAHDAKGKLIQDYDNTYETQL